MSDRELFDTQHQRLTYRLSPFLCVFSWIPSGTCIIQQGLWSKKPYSHVHSFGNFTQLYSIFRVSNIHSDLWGSSYTFLLLVGSSWQLPDASSTLCTLLVINIREIIIPIFSLHIFLSSLSPNFATHTKGNNFL